MNYKRERTHTFLTQHTTHSSFLAASLPQHMQTHLLLREHPRALALRPMMLHEAPSGVLMFEQYTTSLPTTDRAIAKLLPPSEFEDSSWRILNSRPVFGCLGMINLMGGMYGAFLFYMYLIHG